MPRVHLIEGPVGVGKTTFAKELSKRTSAICLNVDEWMANLFRPDRPPSDSMEWYIERKERCIDQIWKLSSDLIDAGTDVILELGLIQQSGRQLIYDRVDAAGFALTIYVLEASREVRRDRVRSRNRDKGVTFFMDVPDRFFEFANNMWEPFDDFECGERDVRFIST